MSEYLQDNSNQWTCSIPWTDNGNISSCCWTELWDCFWLSVCTTDNSPFKNNTPTLDQGQETQGVNHNSWNNLQYTINSPVENIAIMLTSTSANLNKTFTVTEQTYTETRKIMKQYQNTPFPQAIPEFPVYINIPLQPCPPGFSITRKHPLTCDCVRQLRELPGVACDIEDVTIYCSGQVWVGQFKSSINDTEYYHMDIASARYCPFNYCKNGGIRFHNHIPIISAILTTHSGIVCGECMHHLSLVLRNDQCVSTVPTHICSYFYHLQ